MQRYEQTWSLNAHVFRQFNPLLQESSVTQSRISFPQFLIMHRASVSPASLRFVELMMLVTGLDAALK
jgi:hypothetical protein